MTINDIKAAITAKAKSMNLPPVVPVKIKMCSPDEVVRVYEETVTETAPTVKQEPETKPAAAPKQETKTAATVEQEVKAAAVTPKKSTTRKTKTATVIPMDSIEVVVKNLKPGVDFSVIPGLGKKPVLLKAGAEKLASIYGLRSTSKVINRVENYSQMFVLYEVETTIYDSEGNILAVGLGSCNSKEKRYQKGDFALNLNTVLKMARKRSYVDSVLTATKSSGIFSQDEDIIADNMKREAVG